MDERLGYSAEEAAKLSGIGRTLIFAAIRDGQLVARKCGRRTLVLRADLDRFLTSLPTREPKDEEAA